MHILLRAPEDRAELDRRIRSAKGATQRDRYRAVQLALEGHENRTIQQRLARSKTFVEKWCYAYRDHGLEALTDKPRSGRPPKLPREHEQAFKRRMLAGPTRADGGVCTLRGKDAMRVLANEFGVQYTLDGAYDLMKRLNLTCLKPRPRHRKNDAQAMRQWIEDAPLLSTTFKKRIRTSKSKSGSRMKRASASRER